MGGFYGANGELMAEGFWRLLTLLLTSAVLMGLYFVMKEVIYGNDLSTMERVIYYCLLMATIFAGGFLLDRSKR